MEKDKKIRIGCASAFWGDTSTAAKQLVTKGNLDYLVFDFLAEVSMSILAGAKLKNPDMGYATDFVRQIIPILDQIKEKKVKILSNAGGINPEACKDIIDKEAKKQGIELKIAVVKGDNLMDRIELLQEMGITEMEKNDSIPDSCLSINAYLGAPGILKAIENNADIVITGRCVDSALVLAPLMHEFSWDISDYDMLASGSLAGHIIECGAQCTGGNFTDWQEVKGFDNMGFPFIDVYPNGEFIVSKPEGTGGLVSFGTVAEQFLYEIGNPKEYMLPDVVCDFSNVTITELESNQVLVKGAKGNPPTDTYKVSATYMNGYRVAGTLVIGGKESKRKGEIIAQAIIKKCSLLLKENGLSPFTCTSFDLIGSDSIYGPQKSNSNTKEIVLRLLARHPKKEALLILSRELAQAATGMAAGVINYLGGRPSVSPSIHLFSFLLPKNMISIEMEINNQLTFVKTSTKGGYIPNNFYEDGENLNQLNTVSTTPLINLAFARSGDKGDHANIGVIARKPHFFPFIDKALSSNLISQYFQHVTKGEVYKWRVPGINGLNFLLKNSLGGGGMASLNIDPQGKAYAQQLLEYPIPVSKKILIEINKQ